MNSSVERILTKQFMSKTAPDKTGNPAVDRMATALYIGEQAKEWIDKARAKYREHTTWSVTLEESDPAYLVCQQWLLDTMPQTKQKNVIATTRTVYVDPDDGSILKPRGEFDGLFEDSTPSGKSGSVSETRVVLSLSQTQVQTIDIGGHKVKIKVASSQPEDDDNGRPRRRVSSSIRNGRIVFICRSLDAQHAVVAMLNGMVTNKAKRKPALWVADGWGQWGAQDAPARKLNSVVLADGLKEDLMGDLRKFLEDEKRYSELGIPWHRGYLFHGPAGTGKTSLIKALAAELGLDLWYAPLGDLKEDSSLVDLVRSVRSRSVLLLEDVDSYAAARDRDEDGNETGKGISTSALLNALDGVVTPHGLITIMTTNHIDKLDKALVRNGRADRVVELGLPSWNEISQLWDLFFPERAGGVAEAGVSMDSYPGEELSQATVSEIFKRNWDFPDLAYTELMKVIR